MIERSNRRLTVGSINLKLALDPLGLLLFVFVVAFSVRQ